MAYAGGDNPIRDLASSGRLKGSQYHRVADLPSDKGAAPVINNADPGAPSISTSVDCYVSGQYLGSKGQTIDVVQRYTVYVSYSARTQAQTMSEVRDRITADFQSKYGKTFNVGNVYIPSLKAPRMNPSGDLMWQQDHVGPGQIAPGMFYEGARTFKQETRTERKRFEIDTIKSIARTNIGSVKRRYGKI